MKALVALALAVALAGCSSAPLAADAGTERPSDTVKPRPDPTVSGDLTVSSLPMGAAGSNCMFVGFDVGTIVPLDDASVRIDWTSESDLAGPVVLTVGDGALTATGTSPLWLNWTAGQGPSSLPFQVSVAPGPGAVVAMETVHYQVRVAASADAGLEAVDGVC